jgi:hypothetical protein
MKVSWNSSSAIAGRAIKRRINEYTGRWYER